MTYIVYTANVSLDWDTRLRPISEWTLYLNCNDCIWLVPGTEMEE